VQATGRTTELAYVGDTVVVPTTPTRLAARLEIVEPGEESSVPVSSRWRAGAVVPAGGADPR
jgi:hypothetical protein